MTPSPITGRIPDSAESYFPPEYVTTRGDAQVTSTTVGGVHALLIEGESEAGELVFVAAMIRDGNGYNIFVHGPPTQRRSLTEAFDIACKSFQILD